jgi:hypothetical protein
MIFRDRLLASTVAIIWGCNFLAIHLTIKHFPPLFAGGLRNAYDIAFNREGDLFCTDQEGATWVPSGNPLDELLHLQQGRHYGFPPRHPQHLPGVIDEGTVSEFPSYFADWLPTLCDAAGLESPPGLDGESMWPAITANDSRLRQKPMVRVFPEYGGQVAVRIGDLKVMRRDVKTKKPAPWEVYDLSQDRGESFGATDYGSRPAAGINSRLAEGCCVPCLA